MRLSAGSLVAEVKLTRDGSNIEHATFINLGMRASARNADVGVHRWGTSGIAMLASVAA